MHHSYTYAQLKSLRWYITPLVNDIYLLSKSTNHIEIVQENLHHQNPNVQLLHYHI